MVAISSSNHTASVSAIPEFQETDTIRPCDTESIIDLINNLSFSVKEADKEVFFMELETALQKNFEEDLQVANDEVICFLIRHTSTDGKISFSD